MARSARRIPPADALPGGCVYEPKFDGYRALLFVGDGGCRIQSRRRQDITAPFLDVAAVARDQLPSGLVLDGELVVRVDDRIEFTELQQRLGSPADVGRDAHLRPATFVGFDLLCHQGQDVRHLPLRDRRDALEDILAAAGRFMRLSPQTSDQGEAESWMADYAAGAIGLEGIVVKGAGQPYRPGKRDWLKIRVQDTLELIVGAIIGPLTAPDRLVLGQYDITGELVVMGTTNRLSGRDRRSVARFLQLPKNSHPWPSEMQAGQLGGWAGDREPITKVDPWLVVEVSMNDAVDPGGSHGMAEFVRVRPDLTVEETEVVRVARW